MFAYIMGNVSYASADEIVLENNKIGYRIKVPLSTSSKLKEGDEDVKLYTYLSVKDDGLELYGFLTENEFKMFKLLIAVSKVGPKSASAILSSAKVSEIARAVIDNDSALLSKTPGIGKKTAERIVLELGGKVSDFSIASDKDGNFGNAEFLMLSRFWDIRREKFARFLPRLISMRVRLKIGLSTHLSCCIREPEKW